MSIDELLAKILVCAEEALDPAPGRSQVVPGSFAAWDDCCEGSGQLSVRLVSLTPVYQQGAPTCGPLYNIARVGVEIMRCAHTLDEQGNPPSAEQVTGDAAVMLEDMRALSKALLCCDVDGIELEVWEPRGPEGGCAGGEWIIRRRML